MSGSASQLVAREEVGKIKKENIEYTRHVSDSETEEEDEICYISPGNPFFDVILSKRQVTSPFQLIIPKSFSVLLPNRTVPVVLKHGAKNWNMSYVADVPMPRFDGQWRKFVTENRLKLGDACVFELVENTGTNLKFKVHLLRMDDLPGMTIETAICID